MKHNFTLVRIAIYLKKKRKKMTSVVCEGYEELGSFVTVGENVKCKMNNPFL